MTSFLARTFADLAHKPETISAILATSRQVMNCSAVPVTLSTDETYDLICPADQPQNERRILQLFSTFSDTMQFTEKLRIRNNLDKRFVNGILLNLIKKKRYFARTIRLLQVVFPDALIEACSSSRSSTRTVTPLLLSNLRSLSLADSRTMQCEQLKTICSHCPFLENLDISTTYNLNDEGLAFLSTNLKHLKMLALQHCVSMTDRNLAYLADLSSLESLDLADCWSITDSGLEHLAKLASLQTLSLESCDKITDNGLQHLTKLASLQTLNLRHCNKITDTGLEHLANVWSLHSLNIGFCKLITDSGLEHLAKLASLQSLDLSMCKQITDIGLEHLANVSSLHSLDISECSEITDSGLEHIVKLSSLQSLNLRSCNKITDDGLQRLSNLSSLQSLDLGSCRKISDDGSRVFSESTKIIR